MNETKLTLVVDNAPKKKHKSLSHPDRFADAIYLFLKENN